MLKTVKDFILKNNINIDLPVICAVSGGADSVCLLHILYDLGYEVILAHVNHHKRKESEIEAIKMKELANKLNIPFELLDLLYKQSLEFIAMYENNTERDRRVNSISNDVSILRRRQIYQYSLEGAWYIIMGLCTMGI